MSKSLTDIAVTDGLASFVFGENSVHFAELLNKATFFHSTKSLPFARRSDGECGDWCYRGWKTHL